MAIQTFKKSANADFRLASIFAKSMATEKLFINPLYISKTIALEKDATNTSPIFSSLSQFLTDSAKAILNKVWH